jgi:hypothetical protein
MQVAVISPKLAAEVKAAKYPAFGQAYLENNISFARGIDSFVHVAKD